MVLLPRSPVHAAWNALGPEGFSLGGAFRMVFGLLAVHCVEPPDALKLIFANLPDVLYIPADLSCLLLRKSMREAALMPQLHSAHLRCAGLI